MKRLLFFASLLLLCLGQADAQRRSTKKKAKAKVVVVEKTPEEKLYDEFLPSTAKVMFIDSVVVDKADFLSKIAMPESLGKIVRTDGNVTYTNEFGNTTIYASGDTITGRHLYMSHKYGDKWEEPRKISEIENAMADYPFLMADGVTLYFSAEGEGTVGGRDIFRTTYDADESHFYDATNMGLPFNSPANEYLLAISDLDNIGWLVSDRNQPEGKVCVYIFEAKAQRETFTDVTDEEQLKKYAQIADIKSTWGFGNRAEALARYNSMLKQTAKKTNKESMAFVINDKLTYTSLADFKSAKARKAYQKWVEGKKNLAEMNSLLDNARMSYSQTSKSKRHETGRQIVSLENEIDVLEKQLHTQEKEIRRLEND